MLILTLSILPGMLLTLIPLETSAGKSDSIAHIPLLSWAGVLLHGAIIIGVAWILNHRASRQLDLHWPDIAQKVQHYL